MENSNAGQMEFLWELWENQISIREFFTAELLDSLNRHLGFDKVLILYYDTEGNFLSWKNWDGMLADYEGHPYRKIFSNDVIRHMAYNDAVRDHLTCFNIDPRLYKSTDIISPVDYDNSAYVRFIEENFQVHYSVSMAFGINGYIQVVFFKTKEDGDFTDAEIKSLSTLYSYLGNSYKIYKKHEQAHIVSDIQSRIISSGEKAFLVTDDFLHVMSYNDTAMEYLKDILGAVISPKIDVNVPCSWLQLILGEEKALVDHVVERKIKDYTFKIFTHDQHYSNGIIDRYHWITISHKEEESSPCLEGLDLPLTHMELRVAELMCQGLTYKAIASELVISYHTVKNHVQNIYTKCGVKSRFQLCKWLEERKNS